MKSPLTDNTSNMIDNREQPLIHVDNAVKRFGRVAAVNGMDLRVNPGETLTIFGPNGAGKTTLLRMIAGLTQPTSGQITIDSFPLDTHHDEVRGLLGYISHQSLVYDQLTARENLLFFAELYRVADSCGVAKKLLGDVGLTSRADDIVKTFSRGMKQRLSIARALVHSPTIVLLDEPFTGLDQHAADMLMKTLSRLSDEGRTVVMITHNLDVGIDMSSRVAIQVAGKISFDSPTDGLNHNEFRDLYFKTVGEAHY